MSGLKGRLERMRRDVANTRRGGLGFLSSDEAVKGSITPWPDPPYQRFLLAYHHVHGPST